jgi:hypothetical protein
MVSPRGDSWAIVLGILLGALRYASRRRLDGVIAAALIAGTVGGLGFVIMQGLKLIAYMPGNPKATSDPASIEFWAHWHRANWHSILTEQGAGLFYGLGLVLAMAAVSARTGVEPAPAVRQRWTLVLSAAFIVNGIAYTNLVKNVSDWTKARAVAPVLKMPLFGAVELPAAAWFNLIFLLFTICTVTLLVIHLRRPLAPAPATWLGRGQLLFLMFLWTMTIGNFERVVVAFQEQRLATEGTIFVNALLATFLILTLPTAVTELRTEPSTYGPLVRKVMLGGLVLWMTCALAFTGLYHAVYGNQKDGWGGNVRFGPNADWRVRPLLKSAEHR